MNKPEKSSRKIPKIVHASGHQELTDPKKQASFDGKMGKECFFSDMKQVQHHVAEQQKVIEHLD